MSTNKNISGTGADESQGQGQATSKLPLINRVGVQAGEATSAPPAHTYSSPTPLNPITAGAGSGGWAGPIGFDCPVMGQVSFETCVAHARQRHGLPQCGFSLPTLIGIIKHLTHRDPQLDALFEANPRFTFRVTTVTSVCAREAVMNRLFGSEQYVSPHSSYWTWRGEIVHAIKQGATEELVRSGNNPSVSKSETAVAVTGTVLPAHITDVNAGAVEVTNEQRLNTQLLLIVETPEVGLVEVEVTLTGRPDTIFTFAAHSDRATTDTNTWDSVDSSSGGGGDDTTVSYEQASLAQQQLASEITLIDYKTSDFIPPQAKPEHEAQVNIYNYLRVRNGLPAASRLAISYISLKTEAHREVSVWSVEEVEAYLVRQLLPQIESLLAIGHGNSSSLDTVMAANLAQGVTPTELAADESVTNELLEQYLPPRLDPLNPKAGGWKCAGYCQHTARCWPTGVPGSREKVAAKEAAANAGRRAWYGSLKSQLN